MAQRLDLDSLPGFHVTWEIVTEKSAEHGDAAARGFCRPVRSRSTGDVLGVDLEPLERAQASGRLDSYAMPLRAALDALALSGEPWRALETVEGNDSEPGGSRWLSAVWNFGASGPALELPGDGSPVLSATLSLHFPDSISPASRERISRAVLAAL